jgi:hypothetical protein
MCIEMCVYREVYRKGEVLVYGVILTKYRNVKAYFKSDRYQYLGKT